MGAADGPATVAVRVTPPPDDPAGLQAFDGLLRRTGDGRTIVTAVQGTLPPLVPGQRLLLVPGDEANAPTVSVRGHYEGAPATIVVEAVSDAAGRARRATPRVTAPLDVAVVSGDTTPLRGWLVDVSRSGAGVHHRGVALPVGAAVELLVGVGGFAGNGRTTQVAATIVWSRTDDDGLATAGLRFEVGQSSTVSQVLLEARRAARVRRPGGSGAVRAG